MDKCLQHLKKLTGNTMNENQVRMMSPLVLVT